MSPKVLLDKQIKSKIKMDGGWAWRNETVGVWDQKTQTYRKKEESDLGSSDVLGCYKGYMICPESKINKDRMSDRQKKFRDGIMKAGGIYMEVKTYEQFLEDWDKIKNLINLKIQNGQQN